MKYTVRWNWPETTSVYPNTTTEVEAKNVPEAIETLKVKLAVELPLSPVSRVVVEEVRLVESI
jgi:hypothetical protein